MKKLEDIFWTKIGIDHFQTENLVTLQPDKSRTFCRKLQIQLLSSLCPYQHRLPQMSVYYSIQGLDKSWTKARLRLQYVSILSNLKRQSSSLLKIHLRTISTQGPWSQSAERTSIWSGRSNLALNRLAACILISRRGGQIQTGRGTPVRGRY